MMTNRYGPAVAAVLPILLASSAVAHAQTPESQQELRGPIRIVGANTMMELMDRWIAGFTAIHPEVRIELSAKGALTAAPALSDGSADLATLGREFTPSEIAGFHAKRPYDPTGIRVAIGSYDTSGKTVALAFFVNQANPKTRLNFQQLAAIYCNSLLRKALHPITTWGQLGLTGEWASRDIHPVGVNFPDGVSNFIRLRVCKGGNLRQGIREEHTGGSINVLDRIVTDVVADPASIGYAGFANLKPGSKLIAISEDGGPIVKLDLDQLDAIWCTTLRRGGKRQITEWGEVGLTGDWFHRPINLIGVLPPDGVPNFITLRVCNGGLLRDGIHGEENGEPTSVLTRIVQDVAKDPNAIGYAGFHNRQPATHPIQIADTAAGPFYEGKFDEVRSAVYPLTRFVYIYLDRPPDRPLDPPIRKFLSYILSLDGQRRVEEEGICMPLPPLIAAQQRAKLE